MNSLPAAPLPEGDISPSEWSNNLHEHSALPDKIVRATGTLSFTEDFFVPGLKPDVVQANIDGLNQAAKLFQELTEEYGIRHAGFRPMVGELENGGKGAYIISDKIDGYQYHATNTDTTDKGRSQIKLVPAHQVAAEDLLNKLSTYWVKKSIGQELLSDIYSLDQYVYTDPTEEKPHGEFVLVDMDPETRTADQSLTYSWKSLQQLAKTVLGDDGEQQWEHNIDNALDQQYAA